ncbi:MAG: hypothetical protein ACLR43_01610 [Faecalibacillus faecis]
MNEGASDSYKREPGTGDIVQAVRHMRMMNKQIAQISALRKMNFRSCKQLQVPYELIEYVHDPKLPVVNFAAGGVATLQMLH